MQAGWGKRDLYPDFEDEDELEEDKRSWNSLRGTWGKRAAADWQSFRGVKNILKTQITIEFYG